MMHGQEPNNYGERIIYNDIIKYYRVYGVFNKIKSNTSFTDFFSSR